MAQGRVAVIVGAAVVGAAAAGCGALAVGTYLLDRSSGEGIIRTFESAEFDSLAQWPGAGAFEERLELDLPESSRDIRLASDGFQDPIYQIRFTIDPTDLPAIERSPGCGGLLPQAGSAPRESLTTVEVDWWQPEEASSYRQCVGIDSHQRVQHILVDESDPAAADVYIQVFYL
jgi:hypothetical protein